MSWTRRPGSGYGRGSSSTLFTTEKMAVLAAIPRESAAIAVMAKLASRRSRRAALRIPLGTVLILRAIGTPLSFLAVTVENAATGVRLRQLVRENEHFLTVDVENARIAPT